MKLKNIVWMAVAALAVTACAGGVPVERKDYKAEVEQVIREVMEGSGATGFSAAVVYGGEILLEEGFGSKNKTERVEKDTLFQIGSLSKVFTALAVMQLHENGTIDIDEDIRAYLKDFNPKVLNPDHHRVTIRDLLTHHSGLPSNFRRDFELSEADPDLFMQMSRWLSDEYLTWEPGKVFAYNNAAFSLLGELIGTVSGMGYAAYIEEHLFKPLGMNDSLVYHTDRHDPRISGGFTAGEPTPLKFIRDIPAGALLCSARDMGKMVRELISCVNGQSHKILRPETLRSMWRKQNEGVFLDGDFEIGLTFWLEEFHGLAMAGHGGTIPPFHTAMKILPEAEAGVFISANDNLVGDAEMELLARNILAVLLDEPLEEKLPRRGDGLEKRTVDAGTVAKLSGRYAAGSIGSFVLEERESGLTAILPQMGIEGPVAAAGNSLIVDGTNLSITPLEERKENAGFFCHWGHILLGPVIPVESVSLTDPWRNRLGAYGVAEQGCGLGAIDEIILSYQESTGSLTLGVNQGGYLSYFPLRILDGNLLQLQGYGRGMGYVLQYDEAGGEAILTYAGMEFSRSR